MPGLRAGDIPEEGKGHVEQDGDEKDSDDGGDGGGGVNVPGVCDEEDGDDGGDKGGVGNEEMAMYLVYIQDSP